MPPLTITNSANVSLLNAKIITDLCVGKFFVSTEGTVFVGDGSTLVKGIKIKITNPYNVAVKEYGTGYDILPPLSSLYEFPIPKQAGNFQYGKYMIFAQLTDASDKTFEISKSLTIAYPDPQNKTRDYGCLGAEIKGVCRDGKVVVTVNSIPNYKGLSVEDTDQEFTFEFPNNTQASKQVTSLQFSERLYEGIYKISGEVCALYYSGDGVYYNIKYKVNYKKNILCQVDECCVYERLAALHLELKEGCTPAQVERLSAVAIDALRLLNLAQLANRCGEDASDYISDLEMLLQCKCTCNCTEGAPFIGSSEPTGDIIINGCGFTKTVSGLTTTYEFNNYSYKTEIEQNGILSVSSEEIDGCIVRTKLKFDISVAYTKIKDLASASVTESGVWAGIVNKSLDTVNVSSLGLTTQQWSTLTFLQRFQAVVDKIKSCCNCESKVTATGATLSGADVTISWTSTGADRISIYLDGDFVDTVLSSINSYKILGAANGAKRDYRLDPVCANGSVGDSFTGQFTFSGCPTIAAPNLSNNIISNATCPYNLTTLLQAPPTGITYEWHTANNTSASSLVPSPTAVYGGTYYVFAKDANGCYSVSNSVQVVCASGTTCTAPQNLNVIKVDNGHLVSFQSAAYPPPANSYTVKRRLTSDPDVPASYTTIGAPTFNITASRWEILDNTASANTAYTYAAISNCGAAQPAVYFDMINCAAVSNIVVTAYQGDLSFSFSKPSPEPAGGYVIKYRVSGQAQYLYHNVASGAAIPVIVPVDNAYQIWEGDITSKCSESKSSNSVTFNKNLIMPHENKIVTVDAVDTGNGTIVRATIQGSVAIENELFIVGDLNMSGDNADSRTFSVAIPSGQLTADSGYIYTAEEEVNPKAFGSVEFQEGPTVSSKAVGADVIYDLTIQTI